MSVTRISLDEWLDDLCVRFILNLPGEELASVERICFQVEEAQWFYEDFIRPLDPSLPSMNLRHFSLVIFQHCPLLSQFSKSHHLAAFEEFLAYKTRVPVRGAIMLDEAMTHVVLVKGWKKGARWSFPRGKINKDESDLDCAVREVYEETGFDLTAAGLADPDQEHKSIEMSMRDQHMQLFVFRGVPMDAAFEPKTRKEISKIEWYKLSELPTMKQQRAQQHGDHPSLNLQQTSKFYMVAPFLGPLKQWIRLQRKQDRLTIAPELKSGMPTLDEAVQEQAISDVEAVIRRAEGFDFEKEDLLASRDVTADDSHLQALLHGLRASSQPATASQLTTNQVADPADELKRMLNIGRSIMHPHTKQVPPPLSKESRNLLSLLQGKQLSATPSSMNHEQTASGVYARPTHGHHAAPQQQDSYQRTLNSDGHSSQQLRPPSLPLSDTGDQSFEKSSMLFGQPSSAAQMSGLPPANSHSKQLLGLFRTATREGPLRTMQSRPSELTAIVQPRAGAEASRIDVARETPLVSELAATKLNAHAMSLLNAFKTPSQPASSKRSDLPAGILNELSGADVNINGSRPPISESSIAKPRIGSTIASLMQQTGVQSQSVPANRVLQSGLTGPTVTGPLHSPNFDTFVVQDSPTSGPQAHFTDLRARDPPALRFDQADHPSLDIAQPQWPSVLSGDIPENGNSDISKVSMLQRQQQHQQTNEPQTQRASPLPNATFDRRGSVPQGQQNALLSLFNTSASASPRPAANRLPTNKLPVAAGSASTAQLGTAGGASQHLTLQPATDMASPVSPLPMSGASTGRNVVGSVLISPDHPAARSRLPSVDSLAGLHGIVGSQQTPQHVSPSSMAAPTKTSSPAVDKGALLGFLAGVASQGAK